MGQRVYVARESVVAPIALLTVEGIDPGCHQSGVKSVVVARSAVAILETQVCSISILNIYLVQAYFFTGFPASTESGISETLSLGGKFLSLAEKILEFSQKSLSFIYLL